MDPLSWFYYANGAFILLILGLSIYLYGTQNFNTFKNLGIPGPKPKIFSGHLNEFTQGLHVAFDKMQKQYGDYFGCFIGSFPTLVICDPEIIGEIMVKRFSNFTNRPILGAVDDITASMMAIAKDEHWKFIRASVSPSYSTKRLREMAPLMERAVKSFVKNIEKIAGTGQAYNIKNIFASFSIDAIASTGFGLDVNAQKDPDCSFTANARHIFESFSFLDFQGYLAMFPFLSKIISFLKPTVLLGNMAYFLQFWKDCLAEQKKIKDSSERTNAFQIMVEAQVKGNEQTDRKRDKKMKLENLSEWKIKRGLTDDEILAQCMVFVLAGQHTTSTTLALFAHSIAKSQDIQQKLYDEINTVLGQDSPDYDNIQKLTYLDMCLSETLRKYPVATLINREARNDCIIKGVKIPAGMNISIPVTCVHSNPQYWPDPDTFDPERFSKENKSKQQPFTYIPFGGGPRICIGMRLSQYEIRMAAVAMLRKFLLFPCEKRNSLTLGTGVFGLFVAPEGISVRFEPR